ncbi:hypothetical protein BDN70DRAFT_820184 [Pholiota conissans]|uniref:Uncharacterized protein n=1 Tax=Pholiota conissans TaxID=109636 RepID=A0A9P5YM28_9AGAR|nr:hypothetical protein BDN70DRAFT_820184 [Pholiota conissans]
MYFPSSTPPPILIGIQKPGNLCHSLVNARELDGLRRNPAIIRIAGHASASFATWAPKLYTYHEDHFDVVLNHDHSLQRNFTNSVWAATTINFGPRTITRKHRDYSNLPFGWCAVTALGNFDATKGGQLALCSLKRFVDLPSGRTALFPSAAVAHGNTPIAKHEQRYSITQYTAGGIFRWAEQGCQPSNAYMEGLGEIELEMEVKLMAERCKLGLSLYSTLESIDVDLEARRLATSS